jgi:glucose/mannose-6-phosphate isomerase
MIKSTILDRPRELKKIDKSDMLGLCSKTSEYVKDAIKIANRISVDYGEPRHVIVAGMGGSAISGEILRDWLRDGVSIPIDVCRDYNLPAYAGKETLVFAISYSGNTEETISAFGDAVNRGCMIVTITSGGRLLSSSLELGVPHAKIPEGFPPRAAVPYLFFPIPVMMNRVGVPLGVDEDFLDVIQVLERIGRESSSQNPATENPSKRLALELTDTVPVVYGFRHYGSIARRLKTQFNENSKSPSRFEIFPEINHNETVGWEASETITKRFSVILIRDHDEPPEIRRRIEATKLSILHKTKRVLEIHASGNKKLAKMFSALLTGDYTSVYLAILRKIDPTPVKIIDKIKSMLSETRG